MWSERGKYEAAVKRRISPAVLSVDDLSGRQQSFKGFKRRNARSKPMMKCESDDAGVYSLWRTELLSQPHLGKFTRMFGRWDDAALVPAAVDGCYQLFDFYCSLWPTRRSFCLLLDSPFVLTLIYVIGFVADVVIWLTLIWIVKLFFWRQLQINHGIYLSCKSGALHFPVRLIRIHSAQCLRTLGRLSNTFL